MVVLAIESTCDETAVALVRSASDEGQACVEVISNVTASSAEILSKYGGVVPEVAAREQVAAIIPVINEVLHSATVTQRHIDAVAVAYGPGLVGSLLIGIETAKVLALAWKKPLIRVNHMAAHVLANWIAPSAIPQLPAVGLVVSGGHTDIILLKSLTDWEWLGGTRDDAAGEAYDKAARAMGLPYPGGPAIAKLAESVGRGLSRSEFVRLPRPMIDQDNFDLSFSGLKTALIQQASGSASQLTEKRKALLAKEFNEAVTEVLVAKTIKAVEVYKPKSVLLAGGVAANKLLRQNLESSIKNLAEDVSFFVPELKYCTDNAAMIGAVAIMRPDYVEPLLLRPEPGLEII